MGDECQTFLSLKIQNSFISLVSTGLMGLRQAFRSTHAAKKVWKGQHDFLEEKDYDQYDARFQRHSKKDPCSLSRYLYENAVVKETTFLREDVTVVAESTIFGKRTDRLVLKSGKL
jgi:hypothetical protein